MNDDKTIFAPATAAGKAGVAIFRISGNEARKIFPELCDPQEIPQPRKAVLRKLKNPKSQEAIDHVLALYFPAPHSFTGEDVVELHTHGGRAVNNALVECLSELPHFRLAEAGEFTRRAFENGKMDLTEAEAIADLVHAETEAQRKQALRQLDGALGTQYEEWRCLLSRSLAYIEATIDFSDEELPINMIEQQTAELTHLQDALQTHLNDNQRGERLREGFSIAILGPPNAGKSSLLNALTRREAAIVSPKAGTTRDIVEVQLEMGGYPITLADTAGLRESLDEIESEGIRRAYARAARADLTLLVFDGALWPKMDDATRILQNAETISVVNKADLLELKPSSTEGPLFVSAQKDLHIDLLVQRLVAKIEERYIKNAAPPLTRARHRAALEECLDHLNSALKTSMADLRAEDVRLAMRALGRITGVVDVEDLLDIIFRDFCIGK